MTSDHRRRIGNWELTAEKTEYLGKEMWSAKLSRIDGTEDEINTMMSGVETGEEALDRMEEKYIESGYIEVSDQS